MRQPSINLGVDKKTQAIYDSIHKKIVGFHDCIKRQWSCPRYSGPLSLRLNL